MVHGGEAALRLTPAAADELMRCMLCCSSACLSLVAPTLAADGLSSADGLASADGSIGDAADGLASIDDVEARRVTLPAGVAGAAAGAWFFKRFCTLATLSVLLPLLSINCTIAFNSFAPAGVSK